MRKIKNSFLLLNGTKPDLVLILICSMIFLIPTIAKISMNDFLIDELVIGVDDWNRYARHAVDIHRNGLLIESINDNYIIPAGFLYNYFIAACFTIFGENPSSVYCVQSILLGISVALTYFIFRDKLKSKTRILFLLLLIIFAFLDVYKHYTFKFLSENLAIFTIILFFYLFKKTIISKTYKLHLFSGLLLGISVLVRPNILPFSLIILLILVIITFQNKNKTRNYWLLLIGYILIISVLPLRNYLVTGNFSIMPVDGDLLDYISRANTSSISENPWEYFNYYFKKLIYCLGYFPILESNYQIRPHWFIMWLGVLLNIMSFITRPRKIKLFELSLIIFITSFYFLIILIAPITNYGFRFLLPALFITLGFSVIGLERQFDNFQKLKQRNKQIAIKPKRH